MQKLNAQAVCNLLNEKIKDEAFAKVLMNRVDVGGIIPANKTSLNCSLDSDGAFRSSALGLINALVDETICGAIINGDLCEFVPQSKAKDHESKAWDKYEADLIAYNKDHDTNHKPAKRPDGV